MGEAFGGNGKDFLEFSGEKGLQHSINPIQPGGGADLPPPSRIHVYTRTYASKHADFFYFS